MPAHLAFIDSIVEFTFAVWHVLFSHSPEASGEKNEINWRWCLSSGISEGARLHLYSAQLNTSPFLPHSSESSFLCLSTWTLRKKASLHLNVVILHITVEVSAADWWWITPQLVLRVFPQCVTYSNSTVRSAAPTIASSAQGVIQRSIFCLMLTGRWRVREKSCPLGWSTFKLQKTSSYAGDHNWDSVCPCVSTEMFTLSHLSGTLSSRAVTHHHTIRDKYFGMNKVENSVKENIAIKFQGIQLHIYEKKWKQN